MLRGILFVAMIAQVAGGSASANAPPIQARQMPAVYNEPVLQCEFQRQLVFHPLSEQKIAQAAPDMPRLDLCGPMARSAQ